MADGFPIVRGEMPGRDDWLTDDEIRERELAKLQGVKLDTNVKARRLAIMQENRAMLEQANALTRNKQGVATNG